MHGPIDSDENQETSPEGFVWSCCGARGPYAAGCGAAAGAAGRASLEQLAEEVAGEAPEGSASEED